MSHNKGKVHRKSLKVFQQWQVSPVDIVDDYWGCDLQSAVQMATSTKPAIWTNQDAFGAVGSYGKLLRVRPDLLAECEIADDLRRMEGLFRSRPSVIRTAIVYARKGIFPWLRDARRLQRSYFDDTRSGARARMAWELWDDLDGASCLATITAQVCPSAASAADKLRMELEPCAAWTETHGEWFLAAYDWIQAAARALSEDTQTIPNAALADTLGMYAAFLKTAEAAEADVNLRNVQPMAPEAVRRLWETYQRRRRQDGGA